MKGLRDEGLRIVRSPWVVERLIRIGWSLSRRLVLPAHFPAYHNHQDFSSQVLLLCLSLQSFFLHPKMHATALILAALPAALAHLAHRQAINISSPPTASATWSDECRAAEASFVLELEAIATSSVAPDLQSYLATVSSAGITAYCQPTNAPAVVSAEWASEVVSIDGSAVCLLLAWFSRAGSFGADGLLPGCVFRRYLACPILPRFV